MRLRRLIREALEEDIGSGDVTTLAVLTGDETGTAEANAKEDIIVAGIGIFREVFLHSDNDIQFVPERKDGQSVNKSGIIAHISGKLASILSAERVALNIFQRMCGIATLTKKYVDAISGTKAKILDTRKTMPGLRAFDKYAVKIGGGYNHRMGLYGGVLIKDNHISAAGGIVNAVTRALNNIPPALKIEVEVKNLTEVEEALSAGADIIMLDNMNTDDMKQAVSLIDGKALIEASGGVTLSNVRDFAETGVDFISIGAITHSAPAADISLNIVSR
ncbi:MAG: carboxylating nicotinate-nucleotide diphosphorylase [Deltaproteobacteria bacterium]|nr:carboxylating nicotinate-nucleotide diphosphorylase [Deltaproteobacteria bacterium]